MPTFTGSAGNDTLAGTTGTDTLVGLAGNDTYIVNQIDDTIVEEASAGIDTVITSVLDDLATYSLERWAFVENLTYSGTLAALLKGNTANNEIRANAAVSAADTLSGGGGDDTLFGFAGNDQLTGGAGNDRLEGGNGIDTMIGGSGNDSYVVDSFSERVYEYGGGGFDTVFSAVVSDLRVPWMAWVEGLTWTGSAVATLQGNAVGNQLVSLAATADVLNGYAGSDSLDGGAGNDSLNGGTGNDFYFVAVGDVVTELADEGIDTLVGTQLDLSVTSLATTVENLFFTGTGSASLKGNALANVVSGGSGNNTVVGNDGNDTLLGGAGSDSLNGGNGNDVLYGAANDGLVYVPGRRLVADTVADTLAGGSGNDRFLIDSTLDRVSETTSGGTFDVVISTIDNSLARYANVEALVLQAGSTPLLAQGAAGNDILVGNEADNRLEGGAGNDTLAGFVDVADPLSPQSDVVNGGDGDDVLVAFDYGTGFSSQREITLFGGAGNDVYVLGMREDGYGGQDSGGTDTAVLVASGSIDNLEGVNNIVLFGADPGWDARARSAIDTVFAAANSGAGWSGSLGTAANATGNVLANRITGNGLDNQLVGGGGNDTLTGNNGNDTLEGGAGTDSLVGGGGNDWYYLDTGDIAVEAAGAGFDVLASATISSFTGYANFEGLQYLGSSAVNLDRGSGHTSADFLGGGSGNDTVSGFGGNDTLDGGGGHDTVSGNDGNDSLRGGAGNDSVLAGDGQDFADGGDGADVVNGELGDDTLAGGSGNDTLDGGGNWDRIEAGDGDDSAVGSDGNDTIEGGAGDDILFGDNQNDTVSGGAGSDVVAGGSSTRSAPATTSTTGNHLWGGDAFGSGDGIADLFVFDESSLSLDNGATASFPGSTSFNFVAGSTVGDFERGLDQLGIGGSFVGDGDKLIDGVAEKTTAGATFSATAELVLVRPNVADSFALSNTAFFDTIDASLVAQAIGSASAALPVSATRLFVVDDGSHSALFLFQSADGNAQVTIDELFLMAVVTGQPALAASDLLLF